MNPGDCEQSAIRTFADWCVGFRAFCGPRPGGHFLQFEAWQGRLCAVDSTERAINRVVR